MDDRASPSESRARHACEPCRRKKTKCPGEKPACSFCRRLNQRCTYSRNDRVSRDFKSRHDDKERLRRLESQLERMNDVLQTLTEQSSPGARASPREPEVAERSQELTTETMPASVPCFDASEFPHPPPDVLLHYVEIYKTRLHLQPLPLFNVETLYTKVLQFPPFLLRSFLAITMLFSEHPFFGTIKGKAMDFYVRSARETVINSATDGTPPVEILQALCLLTLSDLAAGRRSRMWMNIGLASRLVSSPQSHRSPIAATATGEDKTRCFWSVFVLERAFTPGPALLQSDTFSLANSGYPPSPPRPATVVGLGASPMSSALNDLGVSTHCLQLISIWGEIVAYSRRLRTEQVEDPWVVSSTYHVLVSKYYQFEASLAQIHRFRNVGFQNLSTNELSQNKYYWMAWLQLQMSFHGGHALLHHPVFYITNSRKFKAKYPPPSFLQKTVDQALLHSGWIVRLFRTWEFLGFELIDPFLGHFVVVAATIHWIFQFANDQTVADRASSDFGECQRLVLNLAKRWTQFSSVVNGLEFLQRLARQVHETTGNRGIPSFKQSLLWDLLDSDLPSTEFDASSYLVAPGGQHIETQHLAPLHEPSSVPDREYSDNMLESAGYQPLQSPIFFPSSTLSNDLFSDIDLSIFSRLEAQSSFNLHELSRSTDQQTRSGSVPTSTERGTSFYPGLDINNPKSASIVIIGAGVFGLSTALELSERGYTNVTVLDRRLPPVPDGSSVDVSRIIRPDYADVFYARMGLDAVKGWATDYAPFFHRSGLLCAQSEGSTESSYLEQSKQNLESLGASVTIQTFQGNEATRRYPGIHGDLSGMQGYCNAESGWADAEGSITHLAQKCSQAGVSFMTGRHGTVQNLITRAGSKTTKVVGVRTAAETSVHADTVILATGAWTPYLIDTGDRTISTGQPVAFLQLTPEEAKEMQECPVMIDLSTGWFAFPPTPGTKLLKMARNGFGFETTTYSPHRQSGSPFSAPKMSSQSPFLPSDAEKALREGLALFLPRFKDRPFVQRRLCWYTDTPKGDFIVDYHPEQEGLFLATGGSGHAFKFLPVLGRYVADSFERKASQEQREKWAWTATVNHLLKGDGSRGGPPRRVLRPEEQACL